MQCFKCFNKYDDPKTYFRHIKEVHEICGKDKYRCTLCAEILNEFGRYKKHIEICFRKHPIQFNAERDEFLEAYNDCEMQDVNIAAFQDTVKRSALKLVSQMNANMNIPRNFVYETISQVQTHIDTIVDGITSIVLPRVPPQESSNMKDFVEAITSSLGSVNTEFKFEKNLRKADLMCDIEKCVLFRENKCENGNILMPLSFQIKKFFELPGVFEKIRKNTEELEMQNKLSNFINGSLWKEKIRGYNKDDFVIPYHFYVDAAQLNHPLGPHCAKGAEEFNYYSFPTIPTAYQSRLENIFVASMFPEKYIKLYTLEDIYGHIIEEFTKLAHEGLILKINGVEKKVFFVCGLFIGDNKESNTILSFVRGFRANYYCRYCTLHRNDMSCLTMENPESRRNRQNYDADVLIGDQSQTGVRENAILNNIPHFHVTDSSSEDLTHNVDEGMCHYNLKEILYHFIYDKEYFTLEELNRRMESFPYGKSEKSNVPSPISPNQFKMKRSSQFKKRKFSMTAAEMSNFIQNITFLIGDLIPEEDFVWHFLLNTVKFYDTCYLPTYTDEEIEQWKVEIDHMLTSYQNLFDKKLKPVHHMSIHYPDDTKRYGPLRYTRTIRFEGKHKEVKGYSNNTNNRINISYSIGKKIQYNFAYRLFQSRGLEDALLAKYKPGVVTEKLYWSKLEASQYKNELAQKECLFTNEITVNGIEFSSEFWLPDFNGNKKIHEIVDVIVTLPKTIQDIFAVCKTYSTVTESDHFCSFSVEKGSLEAEFSLIKIEDFLKDHQYPVKVHNINEHFLFRCKRF